VTRLGILLLLCLVAVTPGSISGASTLPLNACTLPGEVRALCGRFDVPENRARPDGRRISLRVAVIPARTQPSLADPVVHITGGPGGSAIADGAGMLTIFSDLNERRDIVLVDQRGTGGSSKLECPLPRRPVATESAVKSYVRSCLAALEADPRRYTTAPAMEDLADVLRALGYSRVNLYGVSYGATAAQYFLAQHPELVRTAILDGATLLDVPIFERLAPNAQRALEAVLRRCERSTRCKAAFPRVRHEAFEVVAALRKKPVRVQGMRIDAATAAGLLQSLTLTPSGAAEIPWIAHRARTGDWVPFLLALDRLGDGAQSSRLVMYMSIVCNEPWARWRPARVAAASRGTFFAERATKNAQAVAAGCSVVPKVPQPAWSRSRVRSSAPVLFVVGGNDPQDPLSHVAGARRELPNSRTVVVPAAGHTAVQLGCMPRVAQAFVERGTAAGLDARCVARYTPPPFVVR
jgi:pimeloyl-ACP methyl ester carboxylesterase